MIMPRRMKRVQMTVLKNDVDAVIEYLGCHEAMHFDEKGNSTAESNDLNRVKDQLEMLRSCAEFLGVKLPSGPETGNTLPNEEEKDRIEKLCLEIDALAQREMAAQQERTRTEETLIEAKAFSSLNAPFEDLDQLSFLTLRIGRIDPKAQPELKKRLAGRAAIIPLGGEGGGASGSGASGSVRILAASSRKGRFALDSELKNCSFEPIAIPKGYTGIPAELVGGLEERIGNVTKDIEQIENEKMRLRNEHYATLRRFASMMLMALAAEQLKSQLVSTASIYILSGWVPADMIRRVALDLSKATSGRIAIRVFAPDEIPEVRDGDEKVPVFLKHGFFVRGFQRMVFSYGVPLYGTIDPTPIVAFFYTLLFGIMFGDVGHGFILLILGILTSKHGLKALASFRDFATPLIAVSISSMVMGLLAGSVFCDEELLTGPTMLITAAITGHPMDRVLHILPMAEKGGSVIKLFYFFGFTIGIGVIINSLGLFINIFNCFTLKKYQAAIFSKTGLAGLVFFWYALFIGLRCIFGGRFEWFDILGLAIPAFFIFFGSILWRCITGKKPALEHHSLGEFIMEGFMEVWETASSYFSNTASFLRVGAFALSHAVLAYIVFYFCENFVHSLGGLGYFPALVLMLIGNSLIIGLEGLVVSIQVLRLQYYEFFSKFFSERGVLFVPFRFRTEG
jgi:V/A-type H+-transporting ATPase subunit I